MTNQQAIVTLAISSAHRTRWHRHCAANWLRYAEQHGYDVICLERPLDTSARAQRRSPSWQKLLVLDQPFAARYERLVWVDADVVINPAAPSIVDAVPVERVGAVDEYACPTRERFSKVLAKLYRYWERSGSGFIRNETTKDFYSAYGLPARYDSVVQNAVMVLSPRHHRELMLDVYRRYDYDERPDALNLEMRPLSYELLEADCVSWLDPRFNYVWGQYKALHFPFLLNHPDHPRAAEAASAALADVYFLHFAGEHDDMQLVRQGRERARLRPARVATRRSAARLRSPVVMLCGSAPGEAQRAAFSAVREARPSQMLVVARESTGTESMAAAVDWDCSVEVCTRGDGDSRWVESGLDWVFGRVAEAVVLADDCVPDPTFFAFCDELLARYRDEERVAAICGDELSSPLDPRPDRYRFSRYPLSWGWATWRRAWRGHEPTMPRWPAVRDAGWLERLLGSRQAATFWAGRFDRAYQRTDSWSDAWTFSCWLHESLCVAPAVNLVSNVGFGWDAPATAESIFADLPVSPVRLPLSHPSRIARDVGYDEFLEDVLYSGNNARLLGRLRAAHAARTSQRSCAGQR